MTAEEQAAAMELLRDPRLLERVLEDFEKCGVVGEETNKKVSYLAAVSRLLGKAAGHRGAVGIVGGQKFADGSRAGLHAGRAARRVLGHDRAGAVLHGPEESQAQNPRRRRKKRARAAPPMR